MKKLIAVLALSFAAATISPALAKHGADDPAGHVRGGHGKDDPAGHGRIEQGKMIIIAKHGADDPAGDDRGGRRGGKGRGADDAPNHG